MDEEMRNQLRQAQAAARNAANRHLADSIVARAAYHRAKGDPDWIAEHLERLLPLLPQKKAD